MPSTASPVEGWTAKAESGSRFEEMFIKSCNSFDGAEDVGEFDKFGSIVEKFGLKFAEICDDAKA